MTPRLPYVALGATALCGIVGAWVAYVSRAGISKLQSGALYFGDRDEAIQLLEWQTGYGLVVAVAMLAAFTLTLMRSPEPAWKVALVPILLSIVMFMVGGATLEAIVIGLGAVGAVRIRHFALSIRMAEIEDEDEYDPDGEAD